MSGKLLSQCPYCGILHEPEVEGVSGCERIRCGCNKIYFVGWSPSIRIFSFEKMSALIREDEKCFRELVDLCD